MRRVSILFLFGLWMAVPAMGLAEPGGVAEDGPLRLSEAQLESVTAGDVSVIVVSNAAASGDPSFTVTRTGTEAWPWGNYWLGGEVAVGKGLAAAAGDENDALVITEGFGEADATLVVRRSVRKQGLLFSLDRQVTLIGEDGKSITVFKHWHSPGYLLFKDQASFELEAEKIHVITVDWL